MSTNSSRSTQFLDSVLAGIVATMIVAAFGALGSLIFGILSLYQLLISIGLFIITLLVSTALLWWMQSDRISDVRYRYAVYYISILISFIGSFFTSRYITINDLKWNPTTFIEDGGIVVMEAEHFTGKIPGSDEGAGTDWILQNHQDYLSGSAIKAVPPSDTAVNTDEKTSGVAVLYQIDFSKSGHYHIYIRGHAPEGTKHDSVHVGLAGEQPITNKKANGMGGIGMGFAENKIDWTNVYNMEPITQTEIISQTEPVTQTEIITKEASSTLFIPHKGTFIFVVWFREDGAIMDRIVLSEAENMQSTNLDALPESIRRI